MLSMMVMYRLILAWLSFSLPAGMVGRREGTHAVKTPE